MAIDNYWTKTTIGVELNMDTPSTTPTIAASLNVTPTPTAAPQGERSKDDSDGAKRNFARSLLLRLLEAMRKFVALLVGKQRSLVPLLLRVAVAMALVGAAATMAYAVFQECEHAAQIDALHKTNQVAAGELLQLQRKLKDETVEREAWQRQKQQFILDYQAAMAEININKEELKMANWETFCVPHAIIDSRPKQQEPVRHRSNFSNSIIK